MGIFANLLNYERENPNLSICGPSCPVRRGAETGGALSDAAAAHILGHLLDAQVGILQPKYSSAGLIRKAIPQDGIEDELRYIYNDLNNAALNEFRRTKKSARPADDPKFRGFSPEARGCVGWEAEAELMAEALRAYLKGLNYLKTVGPNVAERIREFVNPHPTVGKLINFN